MRRVLTLLVVLGLLGVGTYIALFKRGEARRTAAGYRKAETPQVAADMFKKAIEERDYDIAADYCTPSFAEQLRRCGTEANEFAVKLDNLTYQMKERGLIRDEVQLVLAALDPFPKDIKIVVSKESGDTAEAAIGFQLPLLKGNQPNAGSWSLKPEIFNIYVRSSKFVNPNTIAVPLRKDKDVWKFDFPVDPALQLRVGHMKDKYKNYVNPFTIVTQEVKNDPTTKENVTGRLKTLLEQAARE
jgi:hypothetical protein